MQCTSCGGLVIWQNLASLNTYRVCTRCGVKNGTVTEDFEDFDNEGEEENE